MIEHGLDLARFDPERTDGDTMRRESGLEGKLIFGAISKPHWVKNLDALVHAFGPVATDRQDVHLVILGVGNATASRDVQELGLSDRVSTPRAARRRSADADCFRCVYPPGVGGVLLVSPSWRRWPWHGLSSPDQSESAWTSSKTASAALRYGHRSGILTQRDGQVLGSRDRWSELVLRHVAEHAVPTRTMGPRLRGALRESAREAPAVNRRNADGSSATGVGSSAHETRTVREAVGVAAGSGHRSTAPRPTQRNESLSRPA